jgi:hypothetical protein
MNYKQILFIIVANVLNVDVANTIFEPLSVGWYVYLILTAVLFGVCSLVFEDEKK